MHPYTSLLYIFHFRPKSFYLLVFIHMYLRQTEGCIRSHRHLCTNKWKSDVKEKRQLLRWKRCENGKAQAPSICPVLAFSCLFTFCTFFLFFHLPFALSLKGRFIASAFGPRLSSGCTLWAKDEQQQINLKAFE